MSTICQIVGIQQRVELVRPSGTSGFLQWMQISKNAFGSKVSSAGWMQMLNITYI